MNVIEVKNLHYTYPDGTSALHGISIDVARGESIGIIGANGAGKSTFLLNLNGILKGTADIFQVLGQSVEDANLKFIRSKVGVVFQDPDNQLFMPTVFDDVSFGPINMGLGGESVVRAVDKALAEVDMSAAIKRSSHHLSFGEKKRVSIATVLSMDPEILVLDEPSSNLDPKHRNELIDLLNTLNHTKLIATHDLDLVKKCCTRAIIFDKGRIIADGKVEEIISRNNLE